MQVQLVLVGSQPFARRVDDKSFVAVAPQALEIEQVDRQLGVGARGNFLRLVLGRPAEERRYLLHGELPEEDEHEVVGQARWCLPA